MIQMIVATIDIPSALEVRDALKEHGIEVNTGRWTQSENYEIVVECEYVDIPKVLATFQVVLKRLESVRTLDVRSRMR